MFVDSWSYNAPYTDSYIFQSISWLYSLSYQNCTKSYIKEQFDNEYGIAEDEKENNDERNSESDLNDNSERNKDNITEDERKKKGCSMGDDLELFIRRIKNEEFTKETITDDEHVKSYLLRLLDKEERQKLEMKDKNYLRTFSDMNADVPEKEWKETEFKNRKFSRSVAYRRTFFVQTEDEIDDSRGKYRSRTPNVDESFGSEHFLHFQHILF